MEGSNVRSLQSSQRSETLQLQRSPAGDQLKTISDILSCTVRLEPVLAVFPPFAAALAILLQAVNNRSSFSNIAQQFGFYPQALNFHRKSARLEEPQSSWIPFLLAIS